MKNKENHTRDTNDKPMDRYDLGASDMGGCPFCRGNDGSYIVSGGMVSVCDKHKLCWYWSYWTLSLSEMEKAERNEQTLKDYQLIGDDIINL